MTALEPTR